MTVFSKPNRAVTQVTTCQRIFVGPARKALRDKDEPRLVDTQASADTELTGRFQVRTPVTLSVTGGHEPVDTRGSAVDIVQLGDEFYLRRAPGTSATTLTATTPDGINGRVLTRLALEAAARQLAPVALAFPTDLAIEFDISWEADEAWADNVGEGK